MSILNILSIHVFFFMRLQHDLDRIAEDAGSGGVYGYYSIF